jgi:hypothetical protein
MARVYDENKRESSAKKGSYRAFLGVFFHEYTFSLVEVWDPPQGSYFRKKPFSFVGVCGDKASPGAVFTLHYATIHRPWA